MSIIPDYALHRNHHHHMAQAIAARAHESNSPRTREAFAHFEGQEHRLEDVGPVNDVHFINDSRATNVNATWYALDTMCRPVIWLAGGVDDDNDYRTLADLVRTKVKAILCLGADNTRLHFAFAGIVDRILDVTTTTHAVELSYALSTPGDVVLLSPACTSFDRYENYEHRGAEFKQAVRAL